MNAAQLMTAAALAVMSLALLLAGAAVHGATLPVQIPQLPAAGHPAGPALILRDAQAGLTTLAPEATEVTALVDALAAQVTLEHRFRAGPAGAHGGVYVLPLPADAEPRRVTVAAGERRFETALAVDESGDRPELLALPIAAISPHSEVTVTLIYDRPVALGDGRFVLALPLPEGLPSPQLTAAGWTGARVPLELELDPGLPIGELRSPSHGIDIRRGPGERRRILLADSEPASGRDFILVWKPADPAAAIAALRRFTAAERTVEPRPEEALLLRARPLGTAAAWVPALAQSALLSGSPIDDGAILTALAARSGSATGASSARSVSPAIAGSILAIWAVGAIYLATRRGARGSFSATPSTGSIK